MRVPGTSLRFAGLALLLVLATPTYLTAQEQQRNAQIREAQQRYDNFETNRALVLLQAALDPNQGPKDSVWAHGVHLMAQIHFEEGQENIARAWLRWARREVPDMPLDEVLFLPEVVAASNEARDFVAGTADPTGVVRTSWEWSTGSPDAPDEGRIRIMAADPTVSMALSVGNRPNVQQGAVITRPVDSYEIRASATGYRDARAMREVLPGITTVVTFNLERTVVAQEPAVAAPPPVVAEPEREQPPAAPPRQPQQPTARRDQGGGFPIIIVLGGLAAAGGVAALLLAGGGDGGNGGVTCWDGSTAPSQEQCPPRYGGITISVPNRSIVGRRR